GGAPYKCLGHGSHACIKCEFESRAILLSECADAQLDAWQVQPLARTQLAADRDGTFDVVARHALNDELHQTVVEKDSIARLHNTRQRLETHRDALCLSDAVLVREREAVAGHALHRLRFDRSV